MTILDSNAIIYLSKGLVDIDEIICDNEEYAVSQDEGQVFTFN